MRQEETLRCGISEWEKRGMSCGFLVLVVGFSPEMAVGRRWWRGLLNLF